MVLVAKAERRVTIADEVWIATALLHRENPERADFTVQEIRERVRAEAVAGEMRAGVETHIRQHCVANVASDTDRVRLLYATSTRTRRLFRAGDPYDPRRAGGRIVPARENIPERFWFLLDWYAAQYGSNEQLDPILSLRGLGKEIWRGEEPDRYVQRLREGWH
jgi:hypothetical protein